MFRKWLPVLSILCYGCLGVFTLYAQQPRDYADIDPRGQSVTFWYQYSNENEEVLLAIIEEFNQTNEWGITVEGVHKGSYNQIFDDIQAASNSEMPQLVVAYQNQAATLYTQNKIIDLTPLEENLQYGLTLEDYVDYFEGFLDADVFPTFEGVRLGFPISRSIEVMYYNEDWLNELHQLGVLDFVGVPQTPEQFAQASCEAVQHPFSRAVDPILPSYGYKQDADASRLVSWVFAFGGQVFDTDQAVYTFDSSASVEALSFLHGLVMQGCASIVSERYSEQVDFGQGEVLFTIGSTAALSFYEEYVAEGAQFDWGVAPLPYTTAEPVINLYGPSISITYSTVEQELASWIFLTYYANAQNQALWASVSNYFPARQSAAEGLYDYFALKPIYASAFNLLPFGQSEPPTPGYDDVRQRISVMLTNVFKQTTPDIQAELTNLNREVNQSLEQ
ncbi:MAG: extracellular solute-binding protein [Phototrophicaceae bacterium]